MEDQIRIDSLASMLQQRLNDASRRRDLLQSGSMHQRCASESITISRTHEEVSSIKEEIDSFRKKMMKNADEVACRTLLEAYGRYGK